MSGIVDHWKCLNCSYAIDNVLAPHSCPSCGEVGVIEPVAETAHTDHSDL